MTNLPLPPAHIEPYVAVLGIELTIEFLLTFGGAALALSANPTERARIVQVIGMEKARALGVAASTNHRWQLKVPTGKPWIARVLKTQGLPQTEIARRLHVSEVTVYNWLNEKARARIDKKRADDRQLPLL